MRPARRLGGAALALAALGGCAGEGSKPRAHAVAIRGFQYAPAALTVAVGDTVVWTNEDVVPHTATAAGAWDTGSIGARESRRVVVSAKGTHHYVCAFHPGMRARVEAR